MLATLLADEVTLYIKTRNFRWGMESSDFGELDKFGDWGAGDSGGEYCYGHMRGATAAILNQSTCIGLDGYYAELSPTLIRKHATMRAIGLLGTATYTSISTATVTCSALPFALPVGRDVGSLDSNGNYTPSGSFVDTAASAGATSFILNQAPSTAFAASATLVFNQFPEILVKLNHGQHEYYYATATA